MGRKGFKVSQEFYDLVEKLIDSEKADFEIYEKLLETAPKDTIENLEKAKVNTSVNCMELLLVRGAIYPI